MICGVGAQSRESEMMCGVGAQSREGEVMCGVGAQHAVCREKVSNAHSVRNGHLAGQEAQGFLFRGFS